MAQQTFTVSYDQPKFVGALNTILDSLEMSIEQQMPYVAGTCVKGAMNAEKTPKKAAVRKKAKKKAAFELYLDYQANNPDSRRFTGNVKNIYINTGNHLGDVNFVIQHPHTGEIYYPAYKKGGMMNSEFTASTQRFIKEKIKLYNRRVKEITAIDLRAMYLPKAVYYDILLDLQSMGVDLNLLTPKAWTGGRDNIASAVQHDGSRRITHGTAWKFGEGLDFGITVRNSYLSADERKMKEKFTNQVNRFSRKVIADFKHGTFQNFEQRLARYPWAKFAA